MDKNQKKDTPSRANKNDTDQHSENRADQKGQQKNQQLKKEDLPDSTNESKGATGSGQRQDSN